MFVATDHKLAIFTGQKSGTTIITFADWQGVAEYALNSLTIEQARKALTDRETVEKEK